MSKLDKLWISINKIKKKCVTVVISCNYFYGCNVFFASVLLEFWVSGVESGYRVPNQINTVDKEALLLFLAKIHVQCADISR